MGNKLDILLKKKGKHILMNHIVAGYPNINTNINLAESMKLNGTSIIEVQIPFSEPMADGKTILNANHISLKEGTSVYDSFKLVANIKQKFDIATIIMTYVNILFKMGTDKFISLCKKGKVDGIIIPDLPFDANLDGFFNKLNKEKIYPIFVVSPEMDKKRLNKICKIAKGFLYATLKIGITGESRELEKKGIDFLIELRKNTQLPIAAGFGISSENHIRELKEFADISVIGSHIINLFNSEGIDSVSDFLQKCMVVI